MKTIETPGGIPTFLSLKENEMYENLLERTCKTDLSEREIYLIQSLINKNIVKKIVENNKVYYERMKGSL
jgi:hypothetical protein|tara:strand:- start:2489 stop:2698 length:210 start_codon:yes stop_codon:yes gene_type:complete